MTLPQGIDLGPIVTALGTVLVALAGWVASIIRRRTAEGSAQARLLDLVEALSGKAWDRLSPTLQLVLADGRVTAEERSQVEALARSLAVEMVGHDTLEKLARALGLPLPAVIARIASMLIGVWTRAHDPDLHDTESPLAYPVGADLTAEEREKLYGSGG